MRGLPDGMNTGISASCALHHDLFPFADNGGGGRFKFSLNRIAVVLTLPADITEPSYSMRMRKRGISQLLLSGFGAASYYH